MARKTNKTKAKTEVKTYHCDRRLAMFNISPWTAARLTNHFNWVDDYPEDFNKNKKAILQGLKNWKGSQSYRLTVSDNMAIDYVLKCYE